MRRALLLVAALIGAMVAAPASSAAPRTGTAPADSHVPRAAVSPAVARALGASGEIRGVILNNGVPGRALLATTADFPRMAAEGVTSVSIYVYLYVPSPTGTTFAAGPYTPTDAELEQVTAAAHANGLGVQLTPVLLNTGNNVWRGSYAPSNLDEFFRNYTAQLVTYATLAERLGVELFYVGSENDSLAKHTSYWRSSIREVRKHYRGALSYMSTGYQPLNVHFWDALDLASISVYFSMGEDESPTYDRFRAAWREVHTPYVRDLARKIPRPLVYAEVGYNSAQHAFAHPEQQPPGTTPAAPAAQANGYRALLDVLHDNPSVYGVTWFHWAAGSTPGNNTYSPNGKPAECVLAAEWSQDPDVRAAADNPVCDLQAVAAAAAR
jgi:hypothetical protein